MLLQRGGYSSVYQVSIPVMKEDAGLIGRSKVAEISAGARRMKEICQAG
jgi:hypothetical protein